LLTLTASDPTAKWWTALNSQGHSGRVPRNFLRVVVSGDQGPTGDPEQARKQRKGLRRQRRKAQRALAKQQPQGGTLSTPDRASSAAAALASPMGSVMSPSVSAMGALGTGPEEEEEGEGELFYAKAKFKSSKPGQLALRKGDAVLVLARPSKWFIFLLSF
jgi:hypothetical protein